MTVTRHTWVKDETRIEINCGKCGVCWLCRVRRPAALAIKDARPAGAAERVAEAFHALRKHDDTCTEEAYRLQGRCDAHDLDRIELELDVAMAAWLSERKR